MQLARYNRMYGRVLKYQKIIPENVADKYYLSRHKVDILFFLLAYISSLPAAEQKICHLKLVSES